ncbi:hypothetical protein T07_2448 [Trichinella nelsoni]|uniref:Uncharacterized protein n=1 Tax=Trichinella nelsoni TaxID=6336 RepID=A0A0V0S5L4_9BILA|nr:hypothetical protein T07_2448 [Trichinella nelsoni]
MPRCNLLSVKTDSKTIGVLDIDCKLATPSAARLLLYLYVHRNMYKIIQRNIWKVWFDYCSVHVSTVISHVSQQFRFLVFFIVAATPGAMPQAIFRKFRNFLKFSPRRRLRLCPRANKNLHIPTGYAQSNLLHNICLQGGYAQGIPSGIFRNASSKFCMNSAEFHLLSLINASFAYSTYLDSYP